MSRRRPIGLFAATLFALALLQAAPALAADDKRQSLEEKPNIVMVVTDDQTLSMMNDRTMPETLTRIGAEGTTFTNAIATTPLCCPSRASMLTGQYGHNNGVLDNKYRLLGLQAQHGEQDDELELTKTCGWTFRRPRGHFSSTITII